MSYIHSGLIPSHLTYDDEIQLPKMSHNTQKDLQLLHTLNKDELLALCEKDSYVFKLCNDDPILYTIITSSKSFMKMN